LWLADADRALVAARRQAAIAGIRDPNFLLSLADVNFQLGSAWNEKFKDAWGFIVAGEV
jgi:hypothetical protein